MDCKELNLYSGTEKKCSSKGQGSKFMAHGSKWGQVTRAMAEAKLLKFSFCSPWLKKLPAVSFQPKEKSCRGRGEFKGLGNHFSWTRNRVF